MVQLLGELNGKVDVALMHLARINMELFPDEKALIKPGSLPATPLKREEFYQMEKALEDSTVFSVAVRLSKKIKPKSAEFYA